MRRRGKARDIERTARETARDEWLAERDAFNARFPTMAAMAEAARLVVQSNRIHADAVRSGVMPLFKAYAIAEAAEAHAQELAKRGAHAPEAMGGDDDLAKWVRIDAIQSAISTKLQPAIIALLDAGATRAEAASALRAQAA